MREESGQSMTDLNIERLRGTQQRNIYDCGFFALIFAERIKLAENTPARFPYSKVCSCIAEHYDSFHFASEIH